MRRTPCNDGWKVRRKANRFLEMAGMKSEWEQVTLPHDAMIGTERSATATGANAYFPGGVWEYERTLEVAAEDEGTSIALAFEGVYRDVLVHVNREFAGHRPYGYAELVVPIDHLLRYGAENTLRVEARAYEDTRWYSGAGIHRNVWLLRAGRVHLAPDELVVRTPEVDDEVAIVTVETVVRNQSTTRSEAVLRTELLDDRGQVVAAEESPVTTFPSDELTTYQRLDVAEPQRWGVDDPTLYTCRVTLLAGDEVLDEDETTFGIRTLSLDPRRGLRINGEPIDLRGACVHHDNGPIGAATIDRAEERRVELLKAAGFNAIRSAHNPMSRAMLDACDRLGVVVMDETFDMWSQPKTDHDYSLRFADWWKADTESMVRKDRNHPSVVFYSIGNEVPDASTDVGVHQGRAMTDAIRGPRRHPFRHAGRQRHPVDTRRLRRCTGSRREGTGRRRQRRQHLDHQDVRRPVAGDDLTEGHRDDRGDDLLPRCRWLQLHGRPVRDGPRPLPQPGDHRQRDPPGHHGRRVGRRDPALPCGG